MCRICLLLLMVLVCAAPSRSLYAWNDAGHMTVARIAWNHLPHAQREAVVAILQKHPQREQLLRKEKHNESSDAEWIFLRAAVWPDHVRPPRIETHHDPQNHPIYRFHRGAWHYVNFAYRTGQTSTALPAEPIPGQDENDSNILEQLGRCITLLSDDSRDDPDRVEGINPTENKAIRMCWLFHLVGDLHQPLHVGTWVDEDRFPTGTHSDRGGNLLTIRPHAGAAPQNLHQFWDERLGSNAHFSAVSDLAESLTHDPQLEPTRLPELNQHRKLRQWAEESYGYAKTTIYHEGHLQAALAKDYEERRITEEEVPILPQAAEAAAKNVARRRIVLAGYRLANLIRQILDGQ